MNYKTGCGDEPRPRFIPATLAPQLRTVTTPLKIKSEARTKYHASVITEYVDIDTGEIVSAAEAKKHKGFWPEIHVSERSLQRQAAVASLRKEVRDFALFVLQFTNQRRGITPGVSILTRWYAKLHNRQAQHIRRYLPKLMEAGILAGESLLGPLFQSAGKHLTAKAHLSKDSIAALRLLTLAIKQQQPSCIQSPQWLANVETRMNQLLDRIMERVRATKGICKDWASAYQCDE
ncbi:hypothetical protein [Herbaspirillum sp.]|uniref:hypothetical protein n=1 Tax=Herbaspirillum sp. TaxID=1890675 RepID=UPI001AFED577|nr:hypothetical protein [Herbaspirillum sp.]MBO9535211.1 hypothetical protein [Herbaspirillum sp.]